MGETDKISSISRREKKWQQLFSQKVLGCAELLLAAVSEFTS
jgi:hypothetical protein